jgi:hypothetical protein
VNLSKSTCRLSGEEHTTAADRPAAAIRVQPPGGLRRHERRVTALPRCDVPADWLRENLGARVSPDFPFPILRDGTVDPGKEHQGQAAINRELIARTVYGQQEQSTYNGYFESTCYHPLLLFFNRGGECLAAKLQLGNVHVTESWKELLLLQIERQQHLGKMVVFCADAAFTKPEIYDSLEE